MFVVATFFNKANVGDLVRNSSAKLSYSLWNAGRKITYINRHNKMSQGNHQKMQAKQIKKYNFELTIWTSTAFGPSATSNSNVPSISPRSVMTAIAMVSVENFSHMQRAYLQIVSIGKN